MNRVPRRLIAGMLVLLTGLACATGFAAPEGEPVPGDATPDVSYTLRTALTDGRLAFVGATGSIKGQVNPDLSAPEGAIVRIKLINGDGVIHDIVVPEFGADSGKISTRGAATTIVFKADRNGTFTYYCSLPGHKAMGMLGRLVVGEARETLADDTGTIAQDPTAVGQPVGTRAPRHVTLDLETSEVVGRLADGSSYSYWTFDGKVPGPLLRVRVGDRVTVNLSNDERSEHVHSIDLHAATGPGGGAAVTQVAPGQTRHFTFKALAPGLYVYHCATPMVAQHIANGMYGMILVEPEDGLPPVDREFYVMQGELYTRERHGSPGLQELSLDKLLDERPEYFTFNGAVGALTETHELQAQVGDTVRIFFGVGGPNATSSFHVIGETFDRVYSQGSLTSPPLTDVQTTTVAPGGAVMVEFKVDYPGRYKLVDHALARVEKGLVGFLTVHGDSNDEIFQAPHDLAH
ncbi:copper-containing nitrite reductase [Modicisalibacter radicis]|uniref:copper-containing nitrite reductase n=1 Tax=Halomonas sp. EAR18 TaxID=2518972 RepID=UPI001B34C06F|nr:copper-containing nitrite reductase [Halomonas sp. EAR18]